MTQSVAKRLHYAGLVKATAEWRLEAIRTAIQELLEGSGSGDPAPWAMFAIGQIVAVLDMTDDEVEARMRA